LVLDAGEEVERKQDIQISSWFRVLLISPKFKANSFDASSGLRD